MLFGACGQRGDIGNMIHQNESCGTEQISISYLSCILYILEEWTGVERLGEYLSYLIYLTWLFMPLLLGFLLPAVILLLLYISAIIVHIYKRKTDIKEGYLNDFWDGARQMLATMWYAHARIWNGYEVHGLEKLPNGPALIIFYHGATPIDFFYLVATILIKKKRILHIVADHFVFSIPGIQLLINVFHVLHGTKEECKKILENGGLVVISPGGVREALFSDENYTIMWKNRKGFAQVAVEAKVPIIPMFTRNIRENIRIVGGQIILLYGNFPVKLKTYLGDPILYDPNITAEELTEKAKDALQCLIDKHQKIPGNVWRALMERIVTGKQDNE
ncbi:transmembrane protein 68-like isoform X4 [Notechis scutatus]|uniref:Transmembrane protein 68-like isoform X4 n=1 Tax=Notechis scutatus TaxID=8663 RepID=A0A6J1UEE9_9SAUR|nr:transmembrane protein 68-like isoform X4 [Notechis scutatus]